MEDRGLGWMMLIRTRGLNVKWLQTQETVYILVLTHLLCHPRHLHCSTSAKIALLGHLASTPSHLRVKLMYYFCVQVNKNKATYFGCIFKGQSTPLATESIQEKQWLVCCTLIHQIGSYKSVLGTKKKKKHLKETCTKRVVGITHLSPWRQMDLHEKTPFGDGKENSRPWVF